MVIDISRILVKENHSGKEQLVDYWLSQKGNLCWNLSGSIFVKMKSGYTMMTKEDLNNWIPSNCHTKARVPTPSIPKPELRKTKLIFR